MLENLSLKDYISEVDKKNIEPEEVIKSYFQKAVEKNKDIFSFVRFHEDYFSTKINDFKFLPLRWAPIAIKDNIFTKWLCSSCGSRMLENYIAPYSATCFENLQKNWGLMIWKTNMDEFAMWSSTENSYFWITKNPNWKDRIPWGSSGWSAAAVASDSCIAALWTDTGWSIRQPASLCGVVWFKPTYWAVSRYWVQAMWSSLDQVGTLTKTVDDAMLLFDAISWWDSKDATSVDIKKYMKEDSKENFSLAIPNQFLSEWLDQNVKEVILSNIEKIKEYWYEIDWIDVPSLDYALSIYYILMPAEVSTNLARFDGVRYWFQENTFDCDSIQEYYSYIRDKGFQSEVKRRMMIWTYVLSAGYYDAYYLRAQKARKKLKSELDKIFEKYDAIIWPVSPSAAWKIWEKTDDPLKMYLSDIYTIPANLAGLPAISLPSGYVDEKWEKLPVGLHLMTWQMQETKLFSLSKSLENILKN